MCLIVIPFDNRISKDTDLYRLYNTNLHEKIAQGKVESYGEKTEDKEPDMGLAGENQEKAADDWMIYG